LGAGSFSTATYGKAPRTSFVLGGEVVDLEPGVVEDWSPTPAAKTATRTVEMSELRMMSLLVK
jgi:hypothetical protein